MLSSPPQKPPANTCGCGLVLEPRYTEPEYWTFAGKTKLAVGTGEWSAAVQCDGCLAKKEADAEARRKQIELDALYAASGLLPREFEMLSRQWSAPDAFKAPVLAWPGGKRSLYIHGPPGTGKTHAAVVALDGFMSTARKQGKFYVVSDLVRSLRIAIKSHKDDSLINEVAWCPALVLDDIAVERPTGYVLEALHSIIDTRYRNMDKHLIITSNLSIGQLAERLDDRIASRISSMCDTLEFAGRDRRLS